MERSEDEDDWDCEGGKPEHWSLDWSAVVKQRCIIFGYLPEFRKRFISTGLLPYDILCGANLDGGAGVVAGAPKWWSVVALSTSGNTQSYSGHGAARWDRQCHAEESLQHLDLRGAMTDDEARYTTDPSDLLPHISVLGLPLSRELGHLPGPRAVRQVLDM